MKVFRLLGIILCVLQHLDCVECACTLPFGSGTYISNSRGTWITTNTTIKNYKVTIGSLTTTVTFTCSSLYDSNRYILITSYEILRNNYIDIYTCLDIRNSTYSDKYYFYEATALDASIGDYLSGDNASVCNRVNYETAIETKVVIKQGTSDTNKIYCPNIILGNYTYNTTGDYSDMASCNDTQQLTFKKNKAAYVALSSGGNLKCMYYGTGTYVYLITFNNDTSVDNSNTYQFTCFTFSFSGYGSLVYASQRPQSCSSSQTPTNANSAVGKTFIFTPYATCPINETDNRASEDLGWLGGLIAVIVLLIITGTIIVYVFCKKRNVYYKETEESGGENLRDITRYQQQVDVTNQNPHDLEGGQNVGTKRKGKISGREENERILEMMQKKLKRRRRHKAFQIRDDSGRSEASKESLTKALKRLRDRLGTHKRLHPITEQTRLKRGTTASSSINIPNVSIAEEAENEKYSNLPPPEGYAHLVRSKDNGATDREQWMNKNIPI